MEAHYKQQNFSQIMQDFETFDRTKSLSKLKETNE
jgi:hypothetical protein